MKLVLGTFDDVPSARACKDELGRRGYNRVHLIESVNTLSTHGLPREAIQRHRADLERGGCLLVVRCEPAQEPEVRRILEAGYAGGLGGRDTMAQQGTIRVPLAEEEVTVGKSVQQTGGVRLHAYTEERPVETTVNLQEDEDFRAHVDDPATRFGYELADDSTYYDRDWSLLENDARTRWGRSNDISTWDKVKASIRNAFETRRAERRRPIP